LYIGGAEHAVLHLLYARFWHKVLFDLGLVSTAEPFKKLVNQGLITAFSYMRKNKTLVPADEVKKVSDTEFEEAATGEKLEQVIAKMSKSLKNVINPDDIVKEYGADTFRLYEMFLGPLEASKPWNTNGIIGVFRFLEKVWNLFERERYQTPVNDTSTEETRRLTSILNKTIKKVTEDTESLNFNTAISQMMIFVNELSKYKKIPQYVWYNFVKLLGPYAPHLSEELWQKLGNDESIAYSHWPMYVEKFCTDKTCTIVVQVNGKVRGTFEAEIGSSKEALEQTALKNEGAVRNIAGKPVKKVIVVPDKLVNIVVKGSARKVRRLGGNKVLAGFAGGTADAFTLFDRFEAQLERYPANLMKAAVELAKEWRTDRVLRRLEAMLAVADRNHSLIITGNGDVLEPEHGLVAIGSGGAYAQSAALALLENTELSPEEIVKKSLTIAGDLCIYTNQNHTIETL